MDGEVEKNVDADLSGVDLTLRQSRLPYLTCTRTLIMQSCLSSAFLSGIFH